jgi:3-deoxy-7-phosphoheptulonate synthase
MIIVMRQGASKKELNEVLKKIRDFGYKTHIIHGVERDVIGAIGDERGKARLQSLESLSGVEKVVPILKPYKLASREITAEPTVIEVGGVRQDRRRRLRGDGRTVLGREPRAGALDREARARARRTHPARRRLQAAHQPLRLPGVKQEGLRSWPGRRRPAGVTEIVNPADAELIAKYVDMFQVGARNVQNFALLKVLGQIDKPIFLKRGMMTTIEEFLMSAEYILAEGNRRVILCERGIRTFERATRNTLDISAVPVLKGMTHLPVIVDPSHAAGHWQYVLPLSKAAAAVGADGIMVEVHCCPEEAVSDGLQSLKPE